MTEESRTPAAWARNCLEMLQDMNPDYRRNRQVKGRFIEFVRDDESGLSISHNFIRIRQDYYYSCAITFLTNPTTLLLHAMLAGSRFDHNRTIYRQLDDMGLIRKTPGYPSGVWSFGPWRSNTMDNLRRGLLIPEEYLLPYYRKQLKAGKAALVDLYAEAARLLAPLPADIPGDAAAEAIDPGGTKRQTYHRECYCLSALEIARGGTCKYQYGPPEPGFRVGNIPRDAIIASQLEVFLQERDRLPQIIAAVERL